MIDPAAQPPTPVPPDPDLAPGYELLGPAGRGAAGVVYVARDHSGVPRAVKVVDLAGCPDGRPHREERALALYRRLVPRHPHLIEVSHVARAGDRLVYAMELADPAPGPGYRADTLDDRLRRLGRLAPAGRSGWPSGSSTGWRRSMPPGWSTGTSSRPTWCSSAGSRSWPTRGRSPPPAPG